MNNPILQHIVSRIDSGHIHATNNQLISDCPMCEKDNHFYFNPQNLLFHCFSCKTGGKVFIKPGDDGTKRLFKRIKLFVGVDLPSNISFDKQEDKKPCNLGLIPLINEDGSIETEPTGLVVKAYDYCKQRGLSDAQIIIYNVSVELFQNRVYFPYWEPNGTISFYTGRHLGTSDNVPKTLEPKNSEKPLFGRHVQKWSDTIILVEGVFDHFATKHSYAIMGGKVTQNQVGEILNDGVRRVFMVGDSDASASMEASARMFSRDDVWFFPVRLHTKASTDPADIGQHEMGNLVDTLLYTNWKRPQTIDAILD